MSKNKEDYNILNGRNTNYKTENFEPIDTVELEGIEYTRYEVTASNDEGLSVTVNNVLIPTKKDFTKWLEQDDARIEQVFSGIFGLYSTCSAKESPLKTRTLIIGKKQ